MPDLQIRIPASLGLSQEQLNQLGEKFQSLLTDVIRGTQATATALSKPQTVSKAEVVAVRQDVVKDI